MKSSIMPPGYSLEFEVREMRVRVERDFAERLKIATPEETAALKREMEKEIKKRKRELILKHDSNFRASVMW
jgi:hypothetical protein